MSQSFKTPVRGAGRGFGLSRSFGLSLLVGSGLVFGLAVPSFGQSDSSGGRIHFNAVNIRNNDNGIHHTMTLRAVDDDGNTYRMRKVGDKIVELEINGKPVAHDQYDRYAGLLNGLAKPPVPPVPPAAPAGPAMSAVSGAPTTSAVPARPAAPAASASLAMPASPAMPAAPGAPAVAANTAAVAPGAPAMPPGAPAVVPLPPAAALPPAPPAPPEPPRGNKYISLVIDDLINKGIILEDSKLTFSLDNTQLTVNQMKQPDSVFQVFKQKYIKHPGDHMTYERSGSSSIASIKIEDDNH